MQVVEIIRCVTVGFYYSIVEAVPLFPIKLMRKLTNLLCKIKPHPYKIIVVILREPASVGSEFRFEYMLYT